MKPNRSGESVAGKYPAVLYARVSSKDQEKEGFSIPAQLELLRGYAAAQGFTVLQEFVDVETAKQAGRTGFGQMIALLEERTSLPDRAGRKDRPPLPEPKDYVPSTSWASRSTS